MQAIHISPGVTVVPPETAIRPSIFHFEIPNKIV